MSWKTLDNLRSALLSAEGSTAPMIDGLLSSVAEDILDAMTSRDHKLVHMGFASAKEIYEDLVAKASDHDIGGTGFRLGQIAMLTDLLGHFSGRVKMGELRQILSSDINKRIIQELLKGEKTNAMLVERLDKDPAQVSRALKDLREAGVVIGQKIGRTLYSRLSMAAEIELQAIGFAYDPTNPESRYKRLMDGGASVTFEYQELPKLC